MEEHNKLAENKGKYIQIQVWHIRAAQVITQDRKVDEDRK